MLSLNQAIERAFDRCNLAGEGCDIYKYLYSYKAIRNLPDVEIEAIYDRFVAGLGFAGRR